MSIKSLHNENNENDKSDSNDHNDLSEHFTSEENETENETENESEEELEDETDDELEEELKNCYIDESDQSNQTEEKENENDLKLLMEDLEEHHKKINLFEEISNKLLLIDEKGLNKKDSELMEIKIREWLTAVNIYTKEKNLNKFIYNIKLPKLRAFNNFLINCVK